MLAAFEPVLMGEAKEKVLYGGSSSGKTHSVQQYALLKALGEADDETLIVMETQTDVLIGMYEPMKDMLDAWGIPYTPHESVPTSITLQNGHVLWFTPIFRSKGPQSSEAFKKFNNTRRVIINEATALTWDDFLQLRNRMGRTKAAEIIFTFNPIDENHWLCQQYVVPYLNHTLKPTVAVCHTTHSDNPFLTPEKHKEYEDLIDIDQNYYRIYCLGMPGKLEGLIFLEGEKGHWDHQDAETWPDNILAALPTSLGLDWGYSNDQTALVAHWDTIEKRYIHQLIYALNLTITDIIRELGAIFQHNHWPRTIRIFCDPSRPDNIEELKRAGYNALPAVNDINFGIDIIKSKHTIISDQSRDLIREKRGYAWATKNGQPTNKPIDKFNHALDGERYAVASSHTVIKAPSRLVIRQQSTYQNPYAVKRA